MQIHKLNVCCCAKHDIGTGTGSGSGNGMYKYLDDAIEWPVRNVFDLFVSKMSLFEKHGSMDKDHIYTHASPPTHIYSHTQHIVNAQNNGLSQTHNVLKGLSLWMWKCFYLKDLRECQEEFNVKVHFRITHHPFESHQSTTQHLTNRFCIDYKFIYHNDLPIICGSPKSVTVTVVALVVLQPRQTTN